MAKAKVVRPYTPREELWHVLVHGLGIFLGITGTAILVTFASVYADAWAIVSCAIFGASAIFMYSASTAYHLAIGQRAKRYLKKLDHIAIYYLIAGTYTPFLLVNLRGALGWTLFGIIWALALMGTVLKLYLSGSGTKIWSIGLYVGMGWLIVLASQKLFTTIPTIGLVFLILGGLFYTLGIFFYVWKSKEFTHAIWHLFVLMGTVMHFFAILYSCILQN